MKNQIVFLFIVNVLSAIGYSLLAPLYPFIALQKNVSETTIGLVFSCFSFANVITITLTPKYIQIFGRRALFYFGIIIEVIIELK
jgi:MFS family permease